MHRFRTAYSWEVVALVFTAACSSDPSVLQTAGSGGAVVEGGSPSGSGGGPSGTGGSHPGGGGTGNAGAGGASSGGTGGGASGGGTGGSLTDAGGGTDAGTGGTISSRHPGDVGIETDPDVVWVENFEEASVNDFTARYDDFKNAPGMTLDGDVPSKSSGHASIRLTASGTGANATDFYKNLSPGYEELFVRYYAKYQAGVAWHHTGVWIGGYNPPLLYPSPHAGEKPNGDDRFSVSFEPMEQNVSTPRMDFYNYWMKMHSWMDTPMGSTAYYGNTLIHRTSVTAAESWKCIEIHIKLNPDPTSRAGAELGLWMDDASIRQFTDASPLGYWIKDKFCPEGVDGSECTNYPPPQGTTLIPLDLQYRSTSDLKLNAFWPQNYITDNSTGSVFYDDMVVAKTRVGCIQ